MKLNTKRIYATIDWLWRLSVKVGKDCCEVCGGKDVLECHHIITRRNLWLRWETKNGLVVCRKCHERPDLVLNWLEDNQPKRYAWLMAKKNELHPGQRIDLNEIRLNLELRI